MARLPTPGADENEWGDILNDYLSQAHNADGTIKSGAVSGSQLQDGSVSASKLSIGGTAGTTKMVGYNGTGLSWTVPDPAVGGDLTGTASNAQLAANAVTTTAIQDGAVTATKLADGTITAPKLSPGAALASTGLRSLLIYYAPPNIINGKFDDNYAAGVLSRYDDVVLGTGLEDPGSPYYASTTAIISKVAALSPDTIIWGYIDCGVTTGNLSLATLQTQIDQWIAMGARGIFCDVIGYAYQVSRSRQNSIINYIHSKNVGAILNVFDPDEVLSPAVNATYNPSGVATVADETDVLLLESWVCNSDAYPDPHYTTFSDIKTRGDKARTYRQNMGIRLFAANILEHNGRTENEIQEYRDMTEALARIFRLDGSSLDVAGYAASGSDVGVVQPRFSALKSTPFRPTAPYTLNGPWTEVEAPDLGLLVHFEVGTHTWSQL
jgi:hypothetical protein